MSKNDNTTESLFRVKEAEQNNKKEERLRDYLIKVENDATFYTKLFQSDRLDRNKACAFIRGMSSHFNDIGSTRNEDVFVSPRHCTLGFMTHRSEMTDADTSWDVWRVRIANNTRFQEFIGTLMGIKLNEHSEFRYPNGRGRWIPIDPNWEGVPVISQDSFLHKRVMKLVTMADKDFPNKRRPNSEGKSVVDVQEKDNPFMLVKQCSPTGSSMEIDRDENSGSNSDDSSKDSSDSNSTDDSSDDDKGEADEQQETGKNKSNSRNNSSSSNSSSSNSGRHKRSHNGVEREGRERGSFSVPNSHKRGPKGTGKGGRKDTSKTHMKGKSFKKYVKDEAGILVKRVEDTHGFITLDDIYVTGRSKDDGEKNVVETQGILRVVSLTRRKEIMDNLVFSGTKVFRAITQAAADHAQQR